MSHEDEVRSETTNDPYDSNEDTSAWTPWGWTWRGDVDADAETSDDAERRWGRGLFGLLAVAGLVLVFFPEPATSVLGVFLVLVGVIGWLANVIR